MDILRIPLSSSTVKCEVHIRSSASPVHNINARCSHRSTTAEKFFSLRQRSSIAGDKFRKKDLPPQGPSQWGLAYRWTILSLGEACRFMEGPRIHLLEDRSAMLLIRWNKILSSTAGRGWHYLSSRVLLKVASDSASKHVHLRFAGTL
jgi:hypothetical protein